MSLKADASALGEARRDDVCPLILPPRAALPLSPSLSAFPAVAYGFPLSVSRGSTPAEQASLGFLSAFCHVMLPLTYPFIPFFKGEHSSHLLGGHPNSSGTTEDRNILDTHQLDISLGSIKLSILMVSWSIINPTFIEHFL